MIDNLKYATISQIYVRDLIFYDPEKNAELISFCKHNGISLLPSSDRKSCYQLRAGSFKHMELTEEIMCNPYDRLFDEATLAKFEKGSHDEVMFVTEGGKIKGVVHIVDYNNELINFEFYRVVYQFEKMLRGILHFKNETNDSLLEWMRVKGKTDRYWGKRYRTCCPESPRKHQELADKRRNCGPFQTFYLNDLLHFIADRNYVNKSFAKSIHQINSLRNWVAHSQDLAHRTGRVNSPLYRIDELKQFVNHANLFFACYEELEEMVRIEEIKLNFLVQSGFNDTF